MAGSSAEIESHPAADEVLAALERILASEPFRPSAQLRVFLRYVVETTLRGEADRIRAFTIAVEAFGRDQGFNPQGDPIVRVEAARLRRAIEQYYAGPGADDPVEILVPRGGYVPRFSYRAGEAESVPAPDAATAATASRPPVRIGLRAIAAVALLGLVGAAVIGTLLMRRDGGYEIASTTASTPRAAEPARQQGPLPIVSVDPIPPAMVAVAPALAAIRARLADAIARFDDVEVVAEPPATPARQSGPPNVYRLGVSGERNAEGIASVTINLIDAKAGTVIWSRSFEKRSADNDATMAAEKIARVVAPTLAQPFGVIYARERVSRDDPAIDPRYRCLLDAIEYRRTLDAARSGLHSELRTCLEWTIASDPAFPSAQAALAFLLMREFYSGERRDPKGLDEALRLALRAVELKPQSARAHHVLMNILFARGSIAEALAEGERAIALNPYDMTAVTGYGLRLAFAGRAAEGLALLDRVAKLSPARPPMLEFAQFLVNYTLGDDARAAHHASMLTDEVHPFVLIARALVAVKAGEKARAQQMIDRLFTLYPAWRISPRGEIERYVAVAEIVDRIVRDLAPLGFSATN
jgi:tetratricopeptide (TPR) repeat protein